MPKKKKILIVEDDFPLSLALQAKLIKSNLDVILAKNGAEGLKMAIKKHPDLILLDIVMPVMDGITMLRKLRKDKWGKTVPVFILTNLSDDQKISQASNNGIDRYLIKSDYSLGDLIKAINKRLIIK